MAHAAMVLLFAHASPRCAFRHPPGVPVVGANLVMQVSAGWTHVSDRAFRILVRMAVTALDTPSKGQPAAVYHGGRELLAMSLRSEGSDETKFRAVKRAVAELSEAGAIEHVASGWAGQNAVYRLTLNRSRPAVEPTEMGGLIGPPKGGRTSPPMGGQSATERGVAEAPPRNQEEPIREREEEEGVAVSTTSHPPRVTPPSNRCPNHPIRLKPRADGLNPCPLCRAGAPPTADDLADVIPLDSWRAS